MMGGRTKLLLFASALSPLSILFFLIEFKLGLRANSARALDLFAVPYQNVLEVLFFVGIFAFPLFISSRVRDNRTQKRTSWRNK